MLGLIKHGPLFKDYYYEFQLFAIVRSFSDGITFFKFYINLDRWESEHTPAFQIEFTFFNVYSHFWIHK